MHSSLEACCVHFLECFMQLANHHGSNSNMFVNVTRSLENVYRVITYSWACEQLLFCFPPLVFKHSSTVCMACSQVALLQYYPFQEFSSLGSVPLWLASSSLYFPLCGGITWCDSEAHLSYGAWPPLDAQCLLCTSASRFVPAHGLPNFDISTQLSLLSVE